MLHKIERKILKIISKQPSEFILEIEQLTPYSGNDIQLAMNSLKEKGYFIETSASIDCSHFTYELSTQGRFYREYCLQCFMSDIFIPSVVSMVTSLITYFLCG
ncbi:MAG: hypothetical protein HDR06_12355 [Lachnospiraceae bacterium]|nr:hypothetical protein [Lachnospiraceae bacterium]